MIKRLASVRVLFTWFIFKLDIFLQNELKGETGLKGEKGEPGGGYYDPRYGSVVGPPGERGPPVRPHAQTHKAERK